MQTKQSILSPRRKFIGSFVAGAAAIGLFSFKSPFSQSKEIISLTETDPTNPMDADVWFNKLKGKHRIVYDSPHPNEIFPFAWPRVFLLTNAATGSSVNDCGVVVVLRHTSIGFAINDSMWAKYNLGQVFKTDDHLTKKPAVRNPFWQPKADEYKLPGFGAISIGIPELQQSGVMFCVCDSALTVFSAALAEGMKMDAKELKKEWLNNLLPGIQVVPSGVWALGRAQEHKCGYCFAG